MLPCHALKLCGGPMGAIYPCSYVKGRDFVSVVLQIGLPV